jgi:hypothetical protein
MCALSPKNEGLPTLEEGFQLERHWSLNNIVRRTELKPNSLIATRKEKYYFKNNT